MAHMSMRSCASVEALQQIKDVTQDDAINIRQAWKTIKNRGEARGAIDSILRTHGVEYLGQSKRTGEHIYYCNAGDTYATTVIFHGLRMRVGCWGGFSGALPGARNLKTSIPAHAVRIGGRFCLFTWSYLCSLS